MTMRSLLFVPGDSEKKILKATATDADCLILDLEDAVAFEKKTIARDIATAFLTGNPDRVKDIYVRINPLDGPFYLEDCYSIIPACPTGIVIPKVNGVEDILKVVSMLEILEKEHGTPSENTKIIALTAETPESIFSLGDFRELIPRLQALTWGAEDLGASISSTSNLTDSKNWTAPFQLVRSLCLFAAHAAGVEAIDTVMADFKDTEHLATICKLAKRDGFTGKLCIHPSQVPIVNECFSPTQSEINDAETIINAFAENPESGALQIDGVLIDKPHLEKAQRVLQLAGAVAQRLDT